MSDLLEEKAPELNEQHVIPEHVAVIMDGNRRWAKKKNLPSTLGHKEGVKALKNIVKYANKIGVKYLTVYAFSTENWKRKKEEVNFLMSLMEDVLINESLELVKNNVKTTILGFVDQLPGKLPEKVRELEEKTKDNTGLNLQVALNYGSRAEIANAAKEIALKVKNGQLFLDSIDEKTLSEHMLTKGVPDPELLIRTGGELRISNYLLWQCAYSEFYSTEKLWPEFNDEALNEAIIEYNSRQRRFGT